MSDQKLNQAPESDKVTDQEDAYDDMDCRAESKYPAANLDAATPDYIKEMLTKAKKTEQSGGDDGAEAS